ncbi:hypothetical protein JHL18_09025 [Clostridium sp. YIM B02505]|uniref:Uncharacterized protein n=1 Tax=Clostridium yunnanense TaxID=2800325 RepID=A0ABS1ENC4_9CLOT|nr:hypothetical protein [Clostridium yunnanense]MBK1810778.1 hypothetical protein [Clostridium yunnanense]
MNNKNNINPLYFIFIGIAGILGSLKGNSLIYKVPLVISICCLVYGFIRLIGNHKKNTP